MIYKIFKGKKAKGEKKTLTFVSPGFQERTAFRWSVVEAPHLWTLLLTRYGACRTFSSLPFLSELFMVFCVCHAEKKTPTTSKHAFSRPWNVVHLLLLSNIGIKVCVRVCLSFSHSFSPWFLFHFVCFFVCLCCLFKCDCHAFCVLVWCFL